MNTQSIVSSTVLKICVMDDRHHESPFSCIFNDHTTNKHSTLCSNTIENCMENIKYINPRVWYHNFYVQYAEMQRISCAQ